MYRYNVHYQVVHHHPNVGTYLSPRTFDTVVAENARWARALVAQSWKDVRPIKIIRVENLDLAEQRATERAARGYERRRAGV